MKKYGSFIKSISIVLLVQATIYFVIKSFMNDFNIITSFVNIPYVKYFVYFYDSWYPFIILNAFIIYKYDINNYKKLIFTMILGSFLSHITFLIYPTMIIRPDINVKTLTDLLVFITYQTDTPAVNCLPSLHCLFCFILMYYTFKTCKLKNKHKWLIIAYLILIVLSTVFIKQHIIEDVIFSLIYAVIVIFIVKIINKLFDKYLKFLF